MTDHCTDLTPFRRQASKATGRCDFPVHEVHTHSVAKGRFTDRRRQKAQRLKPPFGVTSLRCLFALLLALVAVPLAAQAPGEESAVRDTSCDRECLLGTLRTFMAGFERGDPAAAGLAEQVAFTENNVLLEPGRGLWATVDDIDDVGLELADPWTGNAAWFGSARENGNPVILAVRIHVAGGKVDEIESVVHRKAGLPAPFGDTTNMVHDPAFDEVLPPESRRPRERMIRIADAYFNTVELNDGQVLAPFADDCARLENGISTTAAPPGGGGGNAAAIMAGCENQFKLGLYRINKRIRRDHFIVDEERGVVVSRGFFDHANEFDSYLLTNGREMKTALKWPNTITLLEAFRIKDAQIQRIEAVFTYVPYFMRNPFFEPESVVPQHNRDSEACDDACLVGLTKQVMAAYPTRDWSNLPWASRVAYTENGVGIRVGESIWQTVTAVDPDPLIVADARSGKAVWLGEIEEHGQPAWAAITVQAGEGAKIGGIEAVIRRREYGAPWADPGSATLTASDFGSGEIGPMLTTVRDWFEAALGKVPVPRTIAGDCRIAVHAQDVALCTDLATREALHDSEVLAVDEERGLVVATFVEDFPSSRNGDTGYPRSLQVVSLFRFDGGELVRVEGVETELPYGMPRRR